MFVHNYALSHPHLFTATGIIIEAQIHLHIFDNVSKIY